MIKVFQPVEGNCWACQTAEYIYYLVAVSQTTMKASV